MAALVAKRYDFVWKCQLRLAYGREQRHLRRHGGVGGKFPETIRGPIVDLWCALPSSRGQVGGLAGHLGAFGRTRHDTS